VSTDQQALNREGTVQGMPQSELAAAKAEIDAAAPHPPEVPIALPEELAAAEREFAAAPPVARTAEEEAELASSAAGMTRSEGIARGLATAANCIARGLA
jgi:hypothetical protein